MYSDSSCKKMTEGPIISIGQVNGLMNTESNTSPNLMLPDIIPTPPDGTAYTFFPFEKERGTQIVGMNDPKGDILAKPGEMKRIATNGLNYCNAVAITLTDAEGNRYGHIQHCDPTENVAAAQLLSESRQRLDPEGKYSLQVVIMSPGEYYGIPEEDKKMVTIKPEDLKKTESEEIQAENREAVEMLLNSLQPQDKVSIYLYDTQATWTYYQGTLLIDYLPNGQTGIYAEGKLMKLEN